MVVNAEVLQDIFETIESRKGGDVTISHTASLFAKGRNKITQKFGEEAVETVIEAIKGDKSGVISESADLLFHLLLLWSDQDIKPDDIWRELAKRQGISGIAEKAARER